MSAPESSPHRRFWRDHLSMNDLVAAPMAGVSTPPFRGILRRFFDGIVFTEMVSVEGLCRRIPKTMQYIELSPSDDPIIVQLFGKKPRSFHTAVEVVESHSDPAGYDVNMGCPVKKVVKAGGGCALLNDLDAVHHIAKNMREATDKPVSLKIRLGTDMDNLVYRDIAIMAESIGIDALIVHGRTKKEMFSGGIHYEMLAELAETTSIPIIGNGNVDGPKNYRRMKETGVAGVMIGRAMMKMPWVFAAIRANEETDGFLDAAGVRDLVISFMNAEKESRNGRKYLDVVKKHAAWFTKGFAGSAEFRRQVFSSSVDSDEKVLDLLNFFL